MGIYDRDYYQNENAGFLASLSRSGRVCKWLIGINIVVFLIQTLGGAGEENAFTSLFLLVPEKVLQGEVWRLLTYAFLHADILHILFNMLFLWWFGHELEDIYGHKEFLAFYLVAAVVGGLGFVGWDLVRNEGYPCLGASGAVTAVLVLAAMHFPGRYIWIWFVLRVPIWLFVVIFVGWDLITFLMGSHTTTAVTVHLSGAAFGFLYFKGHWRIMNLWPDLRAWRRARARGRLRVYREEEETPTPRAREREPEPAPVHGADDDLEAKLDEVLKKVSDYGQESLTEHERQVLLQASEIYRRRRR
jgi:membrane associated rhomboid family serine protease